MTAEYLIHLPDGTTDGPFTEEDLLDMVDADELGAGSICEAMATGRRCRVRDLFKVIPPAGEKAPGEPPGTPIEALESPSPKIPARWIPAPLPELPTVAAPAPMPLRTLYTGHPSLWMYWRSLSGALALMAGGWYAGRWEEGGLWLAAGWLSGGLWLALTLFRRSAIAYRVTTRRVEVERGFVK